MVLITPLICWAGSCSYGGCQSRFFGGVFVFLDLLLCLFFYPHRDSYADSLGVLQVLLMLGGCPTS